LVLDEGVIVERGVHDQLLALGGVYATLVRDQEATQELEVALPEHRHVVD
jgi:hypothetical protein